VVILEFGIFEVITLNVNYMTQQLHSINSQEEISKQIAQIIGNFSPFWKYTTRYSYSWDYSVNLGLIWVPKMAITQWNKL